MLRFCFVQLQTLSLLLLLLVTWRVRGQQYTFSHDHNAAVPVPPRFLVPGAFLAPPPEQSYQLQPQPKKLPANVDVDVDDRRIRRPPFVGRRRPEEPAVVANTIAPVPAVTETYRPSTWSTPFLLQQSPQVSVPAPSAALPSQSQPQSPFVYASTPKTIDANSPTAVTGGDVTSVDDDYSTRKAPGTLTPYRPTKVQYYPINNPNIIDENEENAVFHNLKTEPPQISSTTVTADSASPVYHHQHHHRKTQPPRFGPNSIRTPRPQQKTRSQPPSQPVVLPPSPAPPARNSFERVADADNKITRTYDSSPRHESNPNQPRGKRIKKPVAQVLRKYRDDNPDGSITWGFENDDGSYKEETIGNDCVTRGKYGYIDPDGMRREYSYVQGLPCDRSKLQQNEDDDEEDANADELDQDPVVKHRARKPTQKF